MNLSIKIDVPVAVILASAAFGALAGWGASAYRAHSAPTVADSAADIIRQLDVAGYVPQAIAKNPEALLKALQGYQQSQQAAAQAAAMAPLSISDADAVFESSKAIVLGDKSADRQHTIVMFSDYNCGFCRMQTPHLEKLLDQRPDLRIVIRDLPILGDQSREVASVAHAVRDQSPSLAIAFWKAMETKTGHVGRAEAIAVAKALPGIDFKRLLKDQANPSYLQEQGDNIALAQRLAFQGTPTLFIGDHRLAGYTPGEEIVKLLPPGK